MDEQKTLWTSEPFYSPNIEAITPESTIKEATSNVPSQKTLDEWHYKLNEVLNELKPFDGNIYQEIEDIANEIQTYLRG